MQINLQNIIIQPLHSLNEKGINADVLRLDLMHPVISGNKWYKLRYYLNEAVESGCTEIASFGGAYSNHIVALACACRA